MYRTTFALAFSAVTALACGEPTQTNYRGTLAAEARGLRDKSQNWSCRPSAHSAIIGAAPPYLECQGTIADTTIGIASDSASTVLEVIRGWTAATQDAHQEFAQLVSYLQASLGPSGPWCDTLGLTDHAMWQTDSTFVVVAANTTAKQISFSRALGRPYCDPSVPSRVEYDSLGRMRLIPARQTR